MSLEKLIAPLYALDEEVSRQYTVLAEKLESKKIKPEYAGILGALVGSATMPMVSFVEYYANISALRRGKDVTSETIAAPSFLRYIVDQAAKVCRFPILMISGMLMSAGSVDFLDSLINLNLDFREYGLGTLVYSSSCLGLATSMYLRTRDPKLLDKEPLFDRVVAYIKDKAVIPEPASPVIDFKPNIIS